MSWVEVDAALQGFIGRWGVRMDTLRRTEGELATAVAGAAVAYVRTDATAVTARVDGADGGGA